MLRAGVALTFATARSAQAVRAIFGDLPTTLPIVAQNGACLTDLVSGEHLAVHDIPERVARTALSLFRRFGAQAIVSNIADGVDRVTFETPTNDGTRWFIEEKRAAADPRLMLTCDVGAAMSTRVLSLTTFAEEATAKALADALALELGSELQVRVDQHRYALGYWELSVLDRNATKARGIELLRQALDLRDVELVVFGDAENDIDMFRSADVAVAVENAVPELRALASHVVESNESNGVIHWLLEHALDGVPGSQNQNAPTEGQGVPTEPSALSTRTARTSSDP